MFVRHSNMASTHRASASVKVPTLSRSWHDPPPRYSMEIHSSSPRMYDAKYRVMYGLLHVAWNSTSLAKGRCVSSLQCTKNGYL